MTMTYEVHARRWARGWELHIDGVGVTQSRSLSDAEGMVRDYIALAERSRELVRHLAAKGLSGKDTAKVLGVSPQRVSQLLKVVPGDDPATTYPQGTAAA